MVKEATGEFKHQGYEVVRRTALKQLGASCKVEVPPEWDGKEVVVIRME